MADHADMTGLSGHTVRGMVESAALADAPGQPEAVASATPEGLETTIHHAADFALRSLDMAGQAIGQAVDIVSDKAFQSAADVGAGNAIGQATAPAFSWSGYIQALGIMCILLAALWFAVYAIRRWGKFNFLPRPGSLPRDSLVMEAQMPLGPRKGLMVVRFMNRRLLLGVTDGQISLLAEAPCEDGRNAAKFDSLLEDARVHNGDSGI